MKKQLTFFRSSTPDNPMFGYGDHCILTGENDKLLFGEHCSTCPNPWRPSDKAPWEKAYGMIAEGAYQFKFINNHHMFGRCLIINNGNEVPSIIPNVNHNWRNVLSEVFVHRGGINSSADWRGSAGCLTIPPAVADQFFSLFSQDETGNLYIKKLINNKVVE